MGKVKQTMARVSKHVVTENKNSKKRITKKKVTKINGLVPILKKVGIDALLNDSEPEPEFELEEKDEKPVKSLIARPKTDLFDEDQIQSGVSALFQLVEKKSSQKSTLFEDGESIFLQITCIKIPKTPPRQIHLDMPHSLLKNDYEICLIVADREDAKDYDNTIEYYEKVLKKHGISNVKCILPYHQFKNEYGNQFELKRKLASLYDFFLVDGSVHGYVVARLGKIFYDKRKMPVAINMKATELKNHMEKLLNKAVLKVHSKSDCYSVEVGNTKMKPEEVAENVIAISEALNDNFPGGSSNVRSLGVKANKTITIPVYLTLKTKKSVKVPIIDAKRPKEFKPAVGELTTFSNREVTVLPTGEVFIKDLKKQRDDYNDELEEEFEEELKQESESEDEEKTAAKNVKKEKRKVKKQKHLVEEEESEDSNLEEAEENYLNFYQQEQVKLGKERKENKKNKQQNKKVVEEDEESEDDLRLEDSEGSDFDDSIHPNFDESDESDKSEGDDDLHTRGKGKSAIKTNGSAKFEKKQQGGKKGKPQVKQEIKEVIPKPVKKEQVTRGGKQNVAEIKKETSIVKASEQINTKLTKKQQKEATQNGNVVASKQGKGAVLTKQNNNTASSKQNKKRFAVKEEVLDAPSKKVKKETENKFPKQQNGDSKGGKIQKRKPNPFTIKAK